MNRYSTNMKDHSYIITFFTTCFILPLGVIFFCYGKLLRKLKKVSMSSDPTHMEIFLSAGLSVIFRTFVKCA